jgi:hypothetical protein
MKSSLEKNLTGFFIGIGRTIFMMGADFLKTTLDSKRLSFKTIHQESKLDEALNCVG